MNFDPLLQALIVSASLGSLIGLERQWRVQHDRPEAEHPMGLRTFALWSLFGTLSAYISSIFVPIFYPIAFAAIMLLLILSFVFDPVKRGGFGFTTITVALLTFIIGSLVYWEQVRIAIVLTICIIILMASKTAIHDWTLHFTAKDVNSALQFAAITGVILPLVPNRAFGPFDAFNPFSIWLMVVLVVGLGFLGYIAMRVFGERTGIGLTGVIGGMVSSTVTALAFSRQSRVQANLSRSYALAIIIAGTVMLGRVAVLACIVNPQILTTLWFPLLLMAVPGVYTGIRRYRQHQIAASAEVLEAEVVNPLSLKIAIKFAAVYAIIVFITKAAAFYYHTAGVFFVSFISGLTNSSAIVLSLAQMANESQITPQVAAKSITLAILSAFLFKIGVACIVGAPAIRRPLLTTFFTILALGALAFCLI